MIPVGRIYPAPRSVRSRPSAESLEPLAASIRQHGVLQPILVRPSGRGYEVISGVRRVLAALSIGLGEIPAIIRDLDDREALQIAVSENAMHRPLNFEERGRALSELRRFFPTRSDRELESWIGVGPAPADSKRETGRRERETHIEAELPEWMNETASTKPLEESVPAPDATETELTKKYWLEEMVEQAPAGETRFVRSKKLLPLVRRCLEEFTTSRKLDEPLLQEILAELFQFLETGPIHSFLDLTYREPARKYLPRHCLNVAKLAVHLGKQYGLHRSELEDLAVCGLLHDVGMFQVDEKVFRKRAQLSDDEWLQVRSHPLEGQILLTKEALLRDIVARVAMEHHERPNGTGYPQGKKREEIHLYARLVNVVDTYEALASPRVYRLPILPHDAMRAIMDEGARGMLDWELVELFAKSMSLYPIGSYLKLITGEFARVVEANPDTPARPIIQIIADAQRIVLRKPVLVDLAPQDPPVQFEPIPRPA